MVEDHPLLVQFMLTHWLAESFCPGNPTAGMSAEGVEELKALVAREISKKEIRRFNLLESLNIPNNAHGMIRATETPTGEHEYGIPTDEVPCNCSARSLANSLMWCIDRPSKAQSERPHLKRKRLAMAAITPVVVVAPETVEMCIAPLAATLLMTQQQVSSPFPDIDFALPALPDFDPTQTQNPWDGLDDDAAAMEQFFKDLDQASAQLSPDSGNP